MSVAKQSRLKVAQINVENLFLFLDFVPPDGVKSLTEKEWQRLSSASVPNKSLKKTIWLAQALQDINADLIMVNEAGGPESLSNFARHFLDDRYEAHIVEGNSDRGIDVGYLVRRGLPYKTLLISHRHRPLQFLYPHERESNLHFEGLAPDKVIKSHYFSRDCAELRLFRDGDTQPSLIFLLVHLKSKLDPDGIDPQGRERRAAELRTLVAIYREVRAEFNAQVPVIVGGDFNGNLRAPQPEPEFKALKEETDLRNVLEILGRSLEESATQIQFQRGDDPLLLQIDYILIPPELEPHLVKEDTFVYRYKSDLGVVLPYARTIDQRLAMPSDHYPVVATFQW